MRVCILALGALAMTVFTPQELARALLVQEAAARTLAPDEADELDADPSLRDWVLDYARRADLGQISPEEARRLHQQRWPGSPHSAAEIVVPPLPRAKGGSWSDPDWRFRHGYPPLFDKP